MRVGQDAGRQRAAPGLEQKPGAYIQLSEVVHHGRQLGFAGRILGMETRGQRSLPRFRMPGVRSVLHPGFGVIKRTQ